MENRYITTKAAAAMLGVTEGQIKHLLKSGALRGYKPDGQRGWAIEVETVERYDEYRTLRASARAILRLEPETADMIVSH